MKDIPLTETLHTNDINTAPGKGTRGPILLMLPLEATNIVIEPDAPLHLDISLLRRRANKEAFCIHQFKNPLIQFP